MFGWWAIHFFWLDQAEYLWVTAVVLIGIFSTTSFAATFSFQNYNLMGWMFYPLGLWAMLNEQYTIAMIAWMFASIGSITVVAIAVALSMAQSIHIFSPLPFLCTLPAVVKIFLHFPWLNNKSNNIIDSIILRAKAIGITSKGVKYKRTVSKSPTKTFYYFLLLYIVFGLSWLLVNTEFSMLWASAIFLYVVNALYIRFADQESMYMTMLGLSTAMMLQEKEIVMLLPYWLVISPLPYFLLICRPNEAFDIPPKLTPFRVQSVIDVVRKFLSPVVQGQRVLMAFNDPNGVYENIFDGYRVILEAPLYVATTNKIHFFPDWWAVFDTNYEGAPEFWGRELSDVNDNVQKWAPDFVVVYQETGTELDAKWQNAGYMTLSELDWGECHEILKGETPWVGAAPKWWLLKIPEKLRKEE
jgi:hypothetical protein